MEIDTGDTSIALASSLDLQLCITLWDEKPESLVHNDDMIRAVTLRVSEDPSERALDAFRHDLLEIARAAAATERAFAEGATPYRMPHTEAAARALGFSGARSDLRKAYLAYLESPQAAELTAETHVLRAQDHLQTTDSIEEIAQKSMFVADKFAPGIQIYLRLVQKIVESDWDLTKGKGANTLWDMQVAFLIGKDHTYSGRPERVSVLIPS